MARTTSTRWAAAAGLALLAAMAGRCAGGAARTDVTAELQKLNVPSLPKTFTPAQKAQLQKGWDGKGQWFIRTGCVACHSVSVYGVTGLSPAGPDLALAADDVKTRFGRQLDDFLKEPQGTMQMVFTQLLVLTPEQKEDALKHLKEAFEDYQRQKAAATH